MGICGGRIQAVSQPTTKSKKHPKIVTKRLNDKLNNNNGAKVKNNLRTPVHEDSDEFDDEEDDDDDEEEDEDQESEFDYRNGMVQLSHSNKISHKSPSSNHRFSSESGAVQKLIHHKRSINRKTGDSSADELNNINEQQQQGKVKRGKTHDPKSLLSAYINNSLREKSNLRAGSKSGRSSRSRGGGGGGINAIEVDSQLTKRDIRDGTPEPLRIAITPSSGMPNHDTSINDEPRPQLSFKKGHMIDRGSYGEVYQCLDLNTGQLYAVKTIRKLKARELLQKEVAELKNEINQYRHMSHKNIVRYVDTELDEEASTINIILEFVSGGSIRQMLDKFGNFNEKVISIYTHQVLSGLQYLHANRVIHRDIKGGNILIDTDGTIKLTDFGTLKLHKNDAVATAERSSQSQASGGAAAAAGGGGGALHYSRLDPRIARRSKPYWTAPEVIQNPKVYDRASDVWSLGCLVIEMLTALPPFFHLSNATIEEITAYISEGNRPQFPEKISEYCKEFLEKTLQIDPSRRASISELMRLKFIAQPELIDQWTEEHSPNMMRSSIFQSESSIYNADIPRFNQNYVPNDSPETGMNKSRRKYGSLTDGRALRINQMLSNQPENNNNSLMRSSLRQVQMVQGSSYRKRPNKQQQQVQHPQTTRPSHYSQSRQIVSSDNGSQQFDSYRRSHAAATGSSQAQASQTRVPKKEFQSNMSKLFDETNRQMPDRNTNQNPAAGGAQPQEPIIVQPTVEQKEIEDEIMALIRKKKSSRLQSGNTNNTEQSKSETPTEPAVMTATLPSTEFVLKPRIQVIFNNPNDRFSILDQKEIIARNAILLANQYNDLSTEPLTEAAIAVLERFPSRVLTPLKKSHNYQSPFKPRNSNSDNRQVSEGKEQQRGGVDHSDEEEEEEEEEIEEDLPKQEDNYYFDDEDDFYNRDRRSGAAGTGTHNGFGFGATLDRSHDGQSQTCVSQYVDDEEEEESDVDPIDIVEPIQNRVILEEEEQLEAESSPGKSSLMQKQMDSVLNSQVKFASIKIEETLRKSTHPMMIWAEPLSVSSLTGVAGGLDNLQKSSEDLKLYNFYDTTLPSREFLTPKVPSKQQLQQKSQLHFSTEESLPSFIVSKPTLIKSNIILSHPLSRFNFPESQSSIMQSSNLKVKENS